MINLLETSGATDKKAQQSCNNQNLSKVILSSRLPYYLKSEKLNFFESAYWNIGKDTLKVLL